jgi:hypothetical protein
MNSLILLIISVIIVMRVIKWSKKISRPRSKKSLSDRVLRALKSRRNYYRDVYLKSDEWKRKRYVVLKRDNWLCVHCGARATQVHHKRYAPKNIGKEPIEWLDSVCKSCHDSLHK